MLLFKSHNFTAWLYQFHLEKGYFCFSHLFTKIITRYITTKRFSLFSLYALRNIVSLVQRRHLPGSLSHLTRRLAASLSLSQRLKAVNHSIMKSWEVKSLPLSPRKFSSWYPEILSVPRALFTNLSWVIAALLYGVFAFCWLVLRQEDSHEDIHPFVCSFCDSSATIR